MTKQSSLITNIYTTMFNDLVCAEIGNLFRKTCVHINALAVYVGVMARYPTIDRQLCKLTLSALEKLSQMGHRVIAPRMADYTYVCCTNSGNEASIRTESVLKLRFMFGHLCQKNEATTTPHSLLLHLCSRSCLVTCAKRVKSPRRLVHYCSAYAVVTSPLLERAASSITLFTSQLMEIFFTHACFGMHKPQIVFNE